MRTPWIGAFVCFVGFFLSSWLFFGFRWVEESASQEKMLHELFKFAMTTVLVGGAALFYDALKRRGDARHEQSERERDERKARFEKARADQDIEAERTREIQAAHRRRLEAFLQEVLETYNDIKFARRELRSAFEAHTDATFLIDKLRYEDLLRELNRGQLKLEQFRRILESKPKYLSFIKDDGVRWISRAGKYLRMVTKEYENRILEQSVDGASKLLIGVNSKVFQYVVSFENEHSDGMSASEHFQPLDNFFRVIATGIEEQD